MWNFGLKVKAKNKPKIGLNTLFRMNGLALYEVFLDAVNRVIGNEAKASNRKSVVKMPYKWH